MILRKLLMLVFLAAAVCVMSAGVGAAAVITVDDSGGADYTKIQAAVDAASEGDTIEVRSGTYVENVDVGKRLTLIGEGADVVTVTAASSLDHVFEVTADYVNISGFTATGASESRVAGFCLDSADHCNISENTASNSWYGICLLSSSNNTLASNNARSNRYYGIALLSSSNNTLASNNARSNGYYSEGISLSFSSNNKLTGNNCSNNDYGISLSSSSNNMLTGNNVSNNDRGISLSSSSNNTLTGNNCSNSYDGIRLYSSSNNMLTGNNVSNSWYGISLSTSSSYNTLTGNNVSNNDYGISLSSSSNNTLASNTMLENMYNFGVSGNRLSDYTQNIDTSNTVDGKPIYYWVDQKDRLIPNDASFVGVVNGTNITVRDLTLTNNRGGVLFAYTENSRIENVNTSNNCYGIYLLSSSNNTLVSNNANSNNCHGIRLDSSSNNNTLTNNNANSNNFDGILLDSSSNNNMLTNNNANSNNWGGIRLDYLCNNNTLTNNNANSNSYDGIYLNSSSNNTLTNNNANLNSNCGIYLSYSSNNTLASNNASNNRYGIYLSYSSNNNTLANNNANSNNGNGIYLGHSSNNTLASNTADSNNYTGICLFGSSNNTIYHNNFINNNNHNAYDYRGTNQWDSGSEGNYWSDYTGNDTNKDGIGDYPYDIPGGTSVDRYPLTGIRWLPPEITRSRLGINAHWNHWAEDLSIYEQKTKNFGIIRDQAWWAGLETSDLTGSEWASANWNYSYDTETLCGKEITYQSGLDNLVKLYQDEDSPELLLLLNLKNDNISSFETITADQYYDYVYHAVERYDGDGLDDMPGLIRPVRYFEVGNEVDYIRTGDSRHGYLSPKDYIEKRLIPAYNAAKAANKDAVVMGSGLGMESDLLGSKTGEFNTAYLEAMYDNITDNGGSKNNNFYMDKIAIHYYSQNEHPEFFDENIKEVENVIMDKEGREKPIWITEFAPASPPSLYARLLTLMFANRIEMPVIYNLKDDSEESFGLYDVTCEGDEETITPRESIQVIDTVLSTLHSTTSSETENENIFIEPGKTTYKRVFNNSDKKVTVLWYIDTAYPGAVTNYEVSPEPLQTFTVDVLGTANFSQTSPIHLKIGSEPTYMVEADLPIDVDLYFNRTTTAGVSTERAAGFAIGDTLYGKIKTSTSTDHLVKTYITITMPDGTCRYAYYDKPDFTPGIDKLLLSDKKVQLYDGVWHAITDDWLWNIYEFTGGDSGIYAWNCWYEDSETGEILGGNSTEYTFSTTPSGTPVNSGTGKGEVYLDSSAGTLENLVAISPDDMPAMPDSLNPVYGFFSFNITGISSGQSVNIPLAFPDNVPTGTEYWKYGPTPDDITPHWYQIPVSDDDGDRIIVITLTDGGIGDDDLIANSVIIDDGGPSLPLTIDIKPPFSITNLHPTPGTAWINWTWTNPPDPDFNHTEIYINSTFLTNIPAPQNYYNITGLLPDKSYELSTRTVDTSGNINLTWVNDTASTLPASGTTLNLYTGWNLISLPLMPEDTSITSLLYTINGNYSIVWAYNASDTADHWKKYNPGAPFGNDLTTMESGKGYWIMMISDDTLPISVTVPESTDISLKTGWNLIGYNSLESQTITDALSSITGNYSIVWAYDANDTADHWKKYDPSAPFGNDLANMEPGKGYWIMMTTDDIFEIK